MQSMPFSDCGLAFRCFGASIRFRPLLLFCTLSLLAQGCLPPPVKLKVSDSENTKIRDLNLAASQGESLPPIDLNESRFRKRGQIPIEKYRYEGSVWEGESSWGNLMRDHRARYRGDVLTVKDIQNVFRSAENYENDPQAQQILASLDDLSVQVVRTMDNGTLAIYGEKFDYRDGNNTRFRTILKGIVRSKDINDDNEIAADKIARFEIFTEKKTKFDPGRIRFTFRNTNTPNISPNNANVPSQPSQTTGEQGQGGTQGQGQTDSNANQNSPPNAP